MTHSEFHTWLTYHRAKFTCLTPWFEKINERHAQDDSEPSLDDTMTSWFRTLGRYDLDDATRATDMMGVDVPEPPAYERHRHPMVISEICRTLRGETRRETGERQRRYIGGEEVYECALCQDSGFVTVWSVEAMRAARAGTPVRDVTYFDCSTKCTCKAAIGKDRGLAVFNPNTMLPFNGMPLDRTKEPEDLLAFVSSGVVTAGIAKPRED